MFQLLKTDPASRARLGSLTTAHGVVATPAFMPVGTQGTVKAMDPRELGEVGAQIILGNTYHLNLRPGLEIIRKAGGLHPFIAWPHPILTDSGGYQVFSLAKLAKIHDDGVAFQSHLDGAALFLGPKEAMTIQRDLASDIAMVFDDCPPYPASEERVAEAVARTLRWARTCREQPRAAGQLVFGIGQGGVFDAQRVRCLEELIKLDFDGYAIGGLSVGEPEVDLLRAAEISAPLLPADKPRYAMGVGTPAQLVAMVARGVDMFDCVLPTRMARHGTAYTMRGTLSMKASACRDDFRPIEEGCACFACRHFTRAYLRHLLHANEILGGRMLTVHNLHLYLELMRQMRGALQEGNFAQWRERFAEGCAQEEGEGGCACQIEPAP